MKLGIFAKVFARHSLEETLDAVAAHDLSVIQFNMTCTGLPSMPALIGPETAAHIRLATHSRGIEIAALSGTFNMIHPDKNVRREGLQRLEVLASQARPLGASLITLCTGTRDRADMWKHHPENDAPESWRDLLATMTTAVEIADRHDVTLGVEPEKNNVVSSARHCRKLLDTLQTSRLGVVLDLANLIEGINAIENRRILEEAADLLAGEVILAHVKDRGADGTVKPPGQGIVDFPHYFHLLRATGYQGPLIIHGLIEAEVTDGLAYLRHQLEPAN